MSTPDMDREALAIAYLTGQASDTEISEYQTLFSEDESFRAVVREVELWLAPLNDTVTEVDAPEGLLAAIMAEMTPVTSIDSLAPVDSEPSNHSMASNLPMANDGSILAPANDRGAGKWKALACAASLVAALAIGSHFVDYGVGNPQNTAPPQSVIAEADSTELSDKTDILAISMERKGGSKSGAPEGPVLLTGGVSNLRRDI